MKQSFNQGLFFLSFFSLILSKSIYSATINATEVNGAQSDTVGNNSLANSLSTIGPITSNFTQAQDLSPLDMSASDQGSSKPSSSSAFITTPSNTLVGATSNSSSPSSAAAAVTFSTSLATATQSQVPSRYTETPPKDTILIVALVVLLIGALMLAAACLGLITMRRALSRKASVDETSSKVKASIKPWNNAPFNDSPYSGTQYRTDWKSPTLSVNHPHKSFGKVILQKHRKVQRKLSANSNPVRERDVEGLQGLSRSKSRPYSPPVKNLVMKINLFGNRNNKTTMSPAPPPKDPKLISKLPVRIYESLELLPQQLVGRSPSTLRSMKH